jgi:biotin operon repressor
MSLGASTWSVMGVRLCLERYRELCELYKAAMLGSSWLSKIGGFHSAANYPTRRPNLLVTKWDLDIAVPQLDKESQAVFYLRYWSELSHEQIAAILGCSRQRVWRIVQELPEDICRILTRPKRLAPPAWPRYGKSRTAK